MSSSLADLPLLHRGSARSVLLTVLGELVEPFPEPVWNAAFVEVMQLLGFEARTARQAIDRAADAGWIDGERIGRSVRWTLTDRARQMIEAGSQRVHSTSGLVDRWDGRWLVVLVTIPAERRSVRKRLYAALRWEGLGDPSPGLWLSPHADREASATRIIRDLELEETTFSFIGPSASIGLDDRAIVERAWDLDGLAAQYRVLIDRLEAESPAGDESLLATHLELVNRWQRMPFVDPQLPEELLPRWVGRDASRLLQDRRAENSEAVRAEWRRIQDATAPNVALS